MLAYVTGAAGFVASHVCDRLLADGWTVAGIDNFATGDGANLAAARASDRFTFVEADVSAAWEPWHDALDGTLRRPDAILHLASPASPVHYERLALETLAVNALGTMHAVRLAHACGARVLYASTSESYGDPLEHPQRESYWGNVNPIGMRSCYDEGKRFGEAYMTTAVRKLGVDARTVRIFNTYGPRMAAGDGRVVPNFCIAALRNDAFTLYGGGAQTRSFCYVDDLVDGIVRTIARDGLAGCVINLGNPHEHTIAELAAIVARLAGVPLRTDTRERPPDDPVRRRPDITRARDLLGWHPVTSLEDGLRRTLAFFSARRDG